MSEGKQVVKVYVAKPFRDRLKKVAKYFLSSKNIKFKIIFIISFLSVPGYLLGVNLYNGSKYAFIIDGKHYTKAYVRNLISVPQKKDKYTDYVKVAIDYYKYIAVADKLHEFYNNKDLAGNVELEKEYYGINDSNNPWIQLKSKYDTIKNYLDNGIINTDIKVGYYCSFFMPSDDNVTSGMITTSMSNLIKLIKYRDNGSYDISTILSNSPNKNSDINNLSNGQCVNFGTSGIDWTYNVQNSEIISSITNSKLRKSSVVTAKVKNYDGSTQDIYYFYDVQVNNNYPKFTTDDFNGYLKKIKVTNYGV